MQALLVQKSYARCSRSDGFFDDFYDQFLESSDEIQEHFAGVSRAKQKVFAHSGVSTILLYAMGSPKSAERLDALLLKHGPENLNVRPDLYPFWVESLVSAVSRHDPEFNSELDQAWRQTVKSGIEKFLTSQNSG